MHSALLFEAHTVLMREVQKVSAVRPSLRPVTSVAGTRADPRLPVVPHQPQEDGAQLDHGRNLGPALPLPSHPQVTLKPKFLTYRQDNLFIVNHQSGISGCFAWEHSDQLHGSLLQWGRLGQSLDARRVRFRGQSALMAGPRPHLRHQRLQALQRQAVLGSALHLLPFG